MEKDPLLHRNIKALKIIGMWPPENNRNNILFHIYSKFIFVWFVCFTTSQFIEIRYVYHNFKELTANAGVSLLYTVGISKVYIVLFKRKEVSYLVNEIRVTEQKILRGRDVQINKLLQEYILQNWDVTRKFWMLTYFTILGFFTSPRIEALLTQPEEIILRNGTATGIFKKPLVFSSWFPFDKYSSEYYYLAYALQTISGMIGASYLGIWDTFIVALIIYAIGQVRILQLTLRNLYSAELEEEEINERFVACVVHHCKIIRFVKNLNKLISPVMFLDFLVCSLMLCAIGLQAILEGPTVKLGFTIEYLIAMLIQLFMFYWHANEVTLESFNVCSAVWESEWYSCSNKVKKGLYLLLLRAQKPVTLNAGRFYTMSLQTFLLVLRASYSYVALLRQVFGRE